MIYKYDTRYIVEFSNKTRASYSAKRYGPLLELVTQLAIKEDRKVWNYFIEHNDKIEIQYWEQKSQTVKSIFINTDFKDLVYEYYWQLNANGYPQTRTKGEKIFLHHIVMKTKNIVDHIDHNPLNNTRQNLRICNTDSDNCINQSLSSKNTSGHTGVWFDSERKTTPWRARFQYKYQEYTKYFNTYIEACEWIDSQKSHIIQNQKTFND